MKRRKYLSAVSVVSAASLSGCLFNLNQSTVQLGGVVAANYRDETQSLEITIREDDTEHQHVELDLPPASETEDGFAIQALECTWPAEEGAFIIESRANDEEFTLDLAAETADRESNCFVVSVTIDRIFSGLGWSITPCEDVSNPDTNVLCGFVDE
ncbi:hypothetical protein GRX03_04890 [Halovenus sp. WSH3]|uniref:Lipoprotein n=1 Tax=Halovenus carboxidivorans TaxID=2692199 RepID=A0A6B0SZ74_9EURY|nr:hypothetical protein [Halovenus carboxidivorans]MXR50944.1 hypothetical protein [Halovenus carboxidivorans]